MGEAEGSKRQRLSSKQGVGRNAAPPEETYEASVRALGMVEVLGRVMPLVGKGHHVFVATVCKDWQEQYVMVFPSLETSLPSLVASVQRVRWAKECGYELSVGTFDAAAEFGDVSVCKELYRMDCPWDTTVCEAAVRNARHGLRIFKWLRYDDLPEKECCPYVPAGVSGEAGRCGNVEVVKWLLSDEFHSHDLWLEAVKAGHINVLEMMVQHPKVRAQMEVAPDYDGWRNGARWAAQEGNLEVLQWLHVNAQELCAWDEIVSYNSVYFAKSLSVLKWLRSDEVVCPWHGGACPQYLKDRDGAGWDMPPAALEEMKQWVHANGHPCDCQD